MTYKDQRGKPGRVANPEADAEAEAKVVDWATRRRHPDFEAGDDAREKQVASRDVMRINRAVEKFMRDGLGPDDYARLEQTASQIAATPIDQGLVLNKIGAAVNLMLNLILNGEVNPRSAAEAVNVAEALVRIGGTIKVDGAALAAAVVMQGEATDRHEQFRRLLADHRAALEEET